jgi:hypothetical protein
MILFCIPPLGHHFHMSALDTFQDLCFSNWYIAVFERVLFPCETEAGIKKWEIKVSEEFSLDSSAVRAEALIWDSGLMITYYRLPWLKSISVVVISYVGMWIRMRKR